VQGCFTVTDTYSCSYDEGGDCGNFTVCDENDPVYVPPEATAMSRPTMLVDDPGCFTVTDTYTCAFPEGGNCGEFTVCDYNVQALPLSPLHSLPKTLPCEVPAGLNPQTATAPR